MSDQFDAIIIGTGAGGGNGFLCWSAVRFCPRRS
jgi:hypothetical protein